MIVLLTNKGLYHAVACAKSIDEDIGRKIIEQFQPEQPPWVKQLSSAYSACYHRE